MTAEGTSDQIAVLREQIIANARFYSRYNDIEVVVFTGDPEEEDFYMAFAASVVEGHRHVLAFSERESTIFLAYRGLLRSLSNEIKGTGCFHDLEGNDMA